MKEFFADKVRSEEGAETVEIIIGIVVFVVFGIAVFGMITNVAGNKMADVSNCLADSTTILNASSKAKENDCGEKYTDGKAAGGAEYNKTKTPPKK